MDNKITFPTGAENYYDVNSARGMLEAPVPEGYRRWRCILCGFPQGDFKQDNDMIGAFCCGACGQTCVRPIEEYTN